MYPSVYTGLSLSFSLLVLSPDEQSRGGVLEPEGTVEIKYRRKDLVRTMERLDSTYKTFAEELNSPGQWVT